MTESLASAVDIAPTLLEIGGAKRSPGLQGISLLPILRNPETEVREYAFAEHNWHTFRAYERAVMTKDFVYIRNWLPHLSNPSVGDAMRTPAYVQMLDDFKMGDWRKYIRTASSLLVPKKSYMRLRKISIV